VEQLRLSRVVSEVAEAFKLHDLTERAVGKSGFESTVVEHLT
jgi:hypothetical protein